MGDAHRWRHTHTGTSKLLKMSGLCHNLIYEIEIFHSINRKTWVHFVIFLSHVLNLLSEISLFHKLIYDIAPGSFLAHLSQRLEWAVVTAQRSSSVRRLSFVRPSGVNFYIFDFSSETAERNSTKLDRKQDLNALYQVCVLRADRKNKMAALDSDWLIHFRFLLWNC